MSSTPLTERDQHILTMAGASYRRRGGRESDIGQLFSMTPTAFYQRRAPGCRPETEPVPAAPLRLRAAGVH